MGGNDALRSFNCRGGIGFHLLVLSLLSIMNTCIQNRDGSSQVHVVINGATAAASNAASVTHTPLPNENPWKSLTQEELARVRMRTPRLIFHKFHQVGGTTVAETLMRGYKALGLSRCCKPGCHLCASHKSLTQDCLHRQCLGSEEEEGEEKGDNNNNKNKNNNNNNNNNNNDDDQNHNNIIRAVTIMREPVDRVLANFYFRKVRAMGADSDIFQGKIKARARTRINANMQAAFDAVPGELTFTQVAAVSDVDNTGFNRYTRTITGEGSSSSSRSSSNGGGGGGGGSRGRPGPNQRLRERGGRDREEHVEDVQTADDWIQHLDAVGTTEQFDEFMTCTYFAHASHALSRVRLSSFPFFFCFPPFSLVAIA